MGVSGDPNLAIMGGYGMTSFMSAAVDSLARALQPRTSNGGGLDAGGEGFMMGFNSAIDLIGGDAKAVADAAEKDLEQFRAYCRKLRVQLHDAQFRYARIASVGAMVEGHMALYRREIRPMAGSIHNIEDYFHYMTTLFAAIEYYGSGHRSCYALSDAASKMLSDPEAFTPNDRLVMSKVLKRLSETEALNARGDDSGSSPFPLLDGATKEISRRAEEIRESLLAAYAKDVSAIVDKIQFTKKDGIKTQNCAEMDRLARQPTSLDILASSAEQFSPELRKYMTDVLRKIETSNHQDTVLFGRLPGNVKAERCFDPLPENDNSIK